MDKVVGKKIVKTLPDTPGVYLFWKSTAPIYIGKAISLKNRVGSYFNNHLAPKTASMLSEAGKITFIKVNSELEALVLEATLIRKHQPHYNSAAKDDKHPLYIVITDELYPRVITGRKSQLRCKNRAIFGPFPSSANVHSVLKMLRRIFPYGDHLPGKRVCLNYQMGLCSPCPSDIEQTKDKRLKSKMRKTYLWNIRMLKRILSGKMNSVFNDLWREMDKASKEENFERALYAREQIRRLEYITQPIIPAAHFLENPNLAEDLRAKELLELQKILMINGKWPMLNLKRIECFDVAHLHGASPTASMVTFIDGEPDKTFYRHFRLRQKDSQNDLASMMEVAERRTKHFKEWGKPDLIIVDGGKTQVKVFHQIFSKYNIPVVGIAKRFETLVVPSPGSDPGQGRTLKPAWKEMRLPRGLVRNLVQRVRDEAHRFARRYHRKLLYRNLIPNLTIKTLR